MNNPPVVDIFEWTCPLASFGVPKFLSRNWIVAWSEISHHFTFCEFHPEAIEILFVNQIRGILIGNNPIRPTTQNKTDGGFQCSSEGPVVFKPDLPNPFQKRNRNCFDFEIIKLRDSTNTMTRLFVKSRKKTDGRDQ